MKYWDTGKRGWGEKLKEAAKGQEWVESERTASMPKSRELLQMAQSCSAVRGRMSECRHRESSAVNHITPHPLTRVLWAQITGSQPNLAHQSIRQVLLSHNLAWNVSIPPQSWGLRIHRLGSPIHFSLSQQCCPGPQPG